MNFIENESPEKLRGGYYTDPDIALFLCRWATEGNHETVLEPSCGDGAFLEALKRAGPSRIGTLVACEILSSEVAKARSRAERIRPAAKTDVIEGDFITWFLRQLNAGPKFDVAVGNPPFIRYQYLDEDVQLRFQRLFSLLGVPFTRHTNAWVPFVLASVALLKPGGRLAMVVPAELLHVLHTTGLRRYLLSKCSHILVLDPVDLWFEGTLQGVVLLLAEKRLNTDTCKAQLGVVSVTSREQLTQPPATFFESADWVCEDEVNGKWMLALLSTKERALLSSLERLSGIRRLSNVADVDVGIVTGANKFFLVNDDTVERFDLGPFAHPMFGRSEHVPGVIYDRKVHEANRRAGMPGNFLWFGDKSTKEMSRLARSYIQLGEADQLHLRYKCRIRSPWYNVPSVYRTPIAMLKRCHDLPRLVWNRLGALTTDTAYRLRVKQGVREELLVSTFVTSLTALTAELEGRHYGGGVLELVPSEIERLLVAMPPRHRADLERLDKCFREKTAALDLLERRDREVLSRAGLGRDECDLLRAAWNRLRSRRQRETPATAVGSQVTVTTNGSSALSAGA
ncbi:MAG TPA: class I SAM-dependent methyltransferase [Thermoanaerobaculaceae bacterium]|nr:class I SAM-dependent methyltransferase [Thermoanaerobaculaceae bacterium]